YYPRYSYAYPYWGYGSSYPYDYSSSVYSYLPDTYVGATPPVDYRAYYPSAAATTPPATHTVQIDVTVPTGTDLWFDGVKTRTTGASRRFVSPPLTRGMEYQYTVRAQWMDNGRPVTRTRQVTVHAGDRINLDLRAQP